MPIIMAKVCGPTIVLSLGLGGDCPATVKTEARNSKQVIIMER
jgi:hypothetical protein